MPRARPGARKSSARRRAKRYRTKWTHHVIPRRFKRLLFEPPHHIWQEWEEEEPPFVECEEPTIAELSSKNVPDADWPYYLGFMKRMLEILRKYTGTTLELEQQSLIEEYVLRGWPRDLLEQVQAVAEECAQNIRYLYCGCYTDPAIIVKVDLSTFTRVTALTLPIGYTTTNDLVRHGRYLYHLASTSPPLISKIDLAPFTQVDTLTLLVADTNAQTALVVGDYMYVGTDDSQVPTTARIVKIHLPTFTRVAHLLLNVGETSVWGLAEKDGFLYASIEETPGIVVKIDLSTFTRVGAVTFNLGENNAWKMSILNDTLYVVCATTPGQVVEVDLPSFTRVGSLTLNVNENEPYWITSHGANLYVDPTDPIGRLVKLGTNPLSQVTAMTFPAARQMPFPLLRVLKHVYTGFIIAPGIISKVDLATFTETEALRLNPGEDDVFALASAPAYVTPRSYDVTLIGHDSALGKWFIHVDGVKYTEIPTTVSLTEGQHTIEVQQHAIMPCWFDHWVTTGNISVDDPSGSPATLTVNGEGTLALEVGCLW